MNNVISFLKEGILVDPELVEDLKNIPFPLVEVIKGLNISFLSKKDLYDHFYRIKLILENLRVNKSIEEREYIDATINYLSKFSNKGPTASNSSIFDKNINAAAKPLPKKIRTFNNVKILQSSNCKPRDISVDDFVSYYRSRFSAIKSILQEHNELSNLTLINKLSQNNNNISVIGLVSSKRITKNKNILYEIEDLTGKVSVLVNANKADLLAKSKDILLDEVVGFKCSGNSEILFVNDIVFPDATSKKRRLEKEEYAVFISDIHVGSKVFLEQNFMRFIDWINGKSGTEEQKKETKKIKYLFITGDSVDGVGVYPGQEDKLSITDIRLQYEKLAEFLGQIRNDITIIMCPGQHDSVRVAEPQPPLGEEFAKALHNLDNIILVSNPALIELGDNGNREGVRVLMYHGASFHPIINEIEELRLGNARREPTKVIKYWLKKRHLGPPHSTTSHVPIPEGDPLVIGEIPDVLVTGDMHRTDISNYNGILLLNSSCWQSRTDFEEKVGNIPDPSKSIILNLKTWEVKILDFNQ